MGNKIMAAILQFDLCNKALRNKAERAPLAPDHTATILIYTGVRFERIDFAMVKEQSKLDRILQHAEQTRIAN
jgi:hypothetical protein